MRSLVEWELCLMCETCHVEYILEAIVSLSIPNNKYIKIMWSRGKGLYNNPSSHTSMQQYIYNVIGTSELTNKIVIAFLNKDVIVT